MKLRTDKKKITLFGRAIPMTLIVALMVVGIASAAVLGFYGRIQGTMTAQQAILVDGGIFTGVNAYNAGNVAGMNLTTTHMLKNQAQVPVTVGIETLGSPIDGITTSYQLASLKVKNDGTAVMVNKDGVFAAQLNAPLIDQNPYVPGTSKEGTMVIKLPSGTTLGDIQSISWDTFIVSGYLPHVDIILDTNTNGVYDKEDDVLTAEGAHQNNNNITGWATGTWLKTFEGASGVYTPGRGIDDLIGQTADEVKSVNGKTAVWKDPETAAFLNTLSEYQSGTGINNINGQTPVLALEIEVDGWRVVSESYVSNVAINGIEPTLAETTTLIPDETLGLFIRNDFASNIVPAEYTITTSVNPLP